MKNLLLAGLLAFVGGNIEAYDLQQANHEQANQTSINMRLGQLVNYERIELRRSLDELEFSDEEKIILPYDLEGLVNYPRFQIYRDKEQFRQRIYERYGLSREVVREMSALELITKAADIVVDSLVYEEGKDPDLGGFIEDDFNVTGDCSKFSLNLIYIFNLLKEDNENTRNVYIGKADCLGNLTNHVWNAIFVLSKDRLQIAMIDPTHYYCGRNLDDLDEAQFNNNWRNWFYYAIGDCGKLNIQKKN